MYEDRWGGTAPWVRSFRSTIGSSFVGPGTVSVHALSTATARSTQDSDTDYSYALSTVYVGSNEIGGTTSKQTFAGTIDEASIWNRPLTKSEMDALTTAAAVVHCDDAAASKEKIHARRRRSHGALFGGPNRRAPTRPRFPRLAKEHYDQANAQYGLGNYSKAADEYESSFELMHDPALLYNAAQAQRLAGNKQRALLLYQNLLRVYGARSTTWRR